MIDLIGFSGPFNRDPWVRLGGGEKLDEMQFIQFSLPIEESTRLIIECRQKQRRRPTCNLPPVSSAKSALGWIVPFFLVMVVV